MGKVQKKRSYRLQGMFPFPATTATTGTFRNAQGASEYSILFQFVMAYSKRQEVVLPLAFCLFCFCVLSFRRLRCNHRTLFMQPEQGNYHILGKKSTKKAFWNPHFQFARILLVMDMASLMPKKIKKHSKELY
ncbi:MAG: hypothetical protein IJU56_01435 [Clostridia bacterium]|nr:hypothetical protein [Clostridia bacterium]